MGLTAKKTLYDPLLVGGKKNISEKLTNYCHENLPTLVFCINCEFCTNLCHDFFEWDVFIHIDALTTPDIDDDHCSENLL